MSSGKIPISRSCRVKVGISIGDPSGIGPAITLKALNTLTGLADFVIVGDAWVLGRVAHSGRSAACQQVVDLNNVSHKNFAFGKIRAEFGRASIEYLDCALGLIKKKEIDCLVTCPISKEAVNLTNPGFSGHTEYLAAASATKDPVMMLLNERLRFSLVTRHVPIEKVSSLITKERLAKTILITQKYLRKYFLIKDPAMVVCGLNPHASDNGVIGSQENKIIKPMLKTIKGRIDGPLSADVAILKALKKEYDSIIAMYHDQALIPLKLTGFDTGVNITLGLPFVRTSPLHGTAFDVASNFNFANPNSLIAAIKLAVKCVSNLKRA